MGNPAARSAEALRRFQAGTHGVPDGLTRAQLQAYRQQAVDAIENARSIGTQALENTMAVQNPRIQLIDAIIESGVR